MKFYKDSLGNVFAYEEDGSQDDLIGKKTQITNEEAQQIADNIQSKQFDTLNYAQKRQAEYPNILDYIDGIVKGDKAQVENYILACKTVKEKYPKTE